MRSPDTAHQTTSRALAVGCALGAAGALLYMTWFAATDWRAGAVLRSAEAKAYARRACRAIRGCEHLALAPGYGWRHGERHVIYRIEVGLHGGFDRSRTLGTLRTVSEHEGRTWLGWALRAQPVLETRYPAAITRARPRSVR